MRRTRPWILLLVAAAGLLLLALLLLPEPTAVRAPRAEEAGHRPAPAPGLVGAGRKEAQGASSHSAAPGIPLVVEVRALSGDRPVQGAHVVIHLARRVVAEGTTDAGGVLGVHLDAPGSLVVRAEADGLAPSEATIRAAAEAEPARVTLYLAGGHPVRGRVVDDRGRAVPGAIVEATAAIRIVGSRASTQRVRTSSRGVFEFGALPTGREILAARWPSGWGPAGTTLRVPVTGPITLVLPRGATIEGTITSAATGKGLAGATVRLSTLAYDRSAAARTDAAGHYALGPFPPSHPPATIRVTRPGYRPATTDDLAGRGLAAPHPTLDGRSVLDLGLGIGDHVRIDFALDPGAVVVGTVRGPEGPIADAVVRAVPAEGASWTRTDEHGHYRLVALAPRPTLIVVHAPGFVQAGASASLPTHDVASSEAFGLMGVRPTTDHETVRDVKVERGHTLHVRVVDSLDRPLGAATLWVRPTTGGAQPLARPLGHGAFAVIGLAPGEGLTIGARLEGYEGVEPAGIQVAEGAAPDPVVVRLRRRRVLIVRGTVTSHAEAELRGAYVQVAWTDRSGFPLDAVGCMKLWAQTQRQPVRSDGSFSVRLAGAPGRFAVRACALGHVAAETPDQEATRGTTQVEVDLRLAPGLRLEGRVLEEGTERPVQGALIRLTCTDSTRRTASLWYATPSATNAGGSFVVDDLAPATYLLEVRAGGHVPLRKTIEVTDHSDPVAIRLARADGEIAGVVEAGTGSPFPGARVRAIQGGSGLASVRSHPDGTFRLGGLQRSPATVTARAEGQVEARADDIAVGTRDLHLVLEPGVAAAGLLLDGRGRPLPSTWLHFVPSGSSTGTWVRTDHAGRFRASGMAAGETEVRLRAAGKEVRVGRAVLPDEDLVLRR
jgi:hypothetical protein